MHSGDIVDIEHKRNLYRVIVGDAGVSRAEREKSLADESRTKTTDITRAGTALRPHIGDMNVEDFISLQQIDDIEQKITAQEALLTTVKEAAAINARAEFAKTPIPELPADFPALLVRTIDDIAKDAELQIQTHFAAHGLAERCNLGCSANRPRRRFLPLLWPRY